MLLRGGNIVCIFAQPLILTAMFKTPAKDRYSRLMAKDSKGRKFNRIPEHVREVNGKLVHVKSYIRSNRTDCKGKQ